MKLMKILGMLAVLVALFSLTGCDDILEVIFEDELAGKIGGDNDNGIGIYVEVVVPGTDVNDPQLAARVEDINTRQVVAQSFIWPNWDWDNDGNVILSGYIELYGIPAGTDVPREYRAQVWLERTSGENANNGYPDVDEPSKDAEYYDEYNNPNTVFMFPNANGINFIEAGAWLEYFAGGSGLNYDFEVLGDFVVNTLTATATTLEFAVHPWDPDLTESYDEIYWNIFTMDNWTYQTGGDIYKNPTTWPAFDADISALQDGDGNWIEGDYWIEFGVAYTDGWTQYKKLPFRIIPEGSAGTWYDLELDIWSIEYDPWFFSDTKAHKIIYTIFDAYGPTSYTGSRLVYVDEWGDMHITLDSIPYNKSGDVDGVDWLEIAFDANENGYVDDGDLRLSFPLSVSQTELTYDPPSTYLAFDGWDIQPIFFPDTTPAY